MVNYYVHAVYHLSIGTVKWACRLLFSIMNVIMVYGQMKYVHIYCCQLTLSFPSALLKQNQLMLLNKQLYYRHIQWYWDTGYTYSTARNKCSSEWLQSWPLQHHTDWKHWLWNNSSSINRWVIEFDCSSIIKCYNNHSEVVFAAHVSATPSATSDSGE